MIDPKQIPDEAVEAAQTAWDGYYSMRKAIAASLKAWPGAYADDETMYGKVIGRTIFLPLTKESSDEN
jgi:hypothetical protein